MMPAGYGRYAKAAVAVEKKEDILLILLDTVSMDLKKARMGIEQDNAKIKGEAISRAGAIFTELDCALDHEADRDLTENLSRLYQFMMDRLTVANLKNDENALDDAAKVLAHLHDGFREAAGTRKENHRPATAKPFENEGEALSQMSRSISVAV